MSTKILAFAGSLRAGSVNKKLVAVAAQKARDAGAEVTVIDLKDYPLPVFDGGQQVLRPAGGIPQGRHTLDRAAVDDTGDLDGDGSRSCADLALFVDGLTDAPGLDAVLPDQTWRLLADADGNGVRDRRDFEAIHRMLTETSCDVGGGAPGTHGMPLLSLSGPLTEGSTATLSLTNALENGSAWLFLGLGTTLLPFRGGVFVPRPDVVLGNLPIDGSGELVIRLPWSGFPAGLPTYWQYWIPDPGATYTYAGSNGVAALAR